jgi:hypothetical protein
MTVVQLTSGKVKIRPAVVADLGFIIKSWSMSNSEFVTETLHIQEPEMFTSVMKLISAVTHPTITELCKGAKTVLVACDPNNLDNLHGFIVVDQGTIFPIVHYCFVKFGVRKQGIATALFEVALCHCGIPPVIVNCTHWGYIVGRIAPNHGLVYNPTQKKQHNKKEMNSQ